MKSASRKRDRVKDLRVHLDWILLILILFFTFVAIILVPAFLTVDKLVSVPYALHSILTADYGVDDMAISYAQVKSDIIAEAIRDQNDPKLGDIPGKQGLNPPIAMTTPYPDSTGTPTSFPGFPTATPAPTDRIFNPTVTNIYPSPTDGGTPTSTQLSATDSPTQAATSHPPDPTSISPTRTTAPTTQAPNPTSPPRTPTPRPPTRTPAPTAPRPTNTPRPPDPTDPPDPPDPYPPPSDDTPYP